MSQTEQYISGNMDEGLTVKEALDRIAKYNPESFVWNEIPGDVTVDLNDIASCPNITGPGDYTIFSFTNGPEGVKSIPLNLSIRKADSSDELVLFVFDGLKQFMKEGSAAWAALPSYNTNVLSILRSNEPPEDTKLYWLDISHYQNGEGYIDLKYYNGTEWVSIFNSPELMFTTTYDGNANATNMYKYINDLIAASNREVSEFTKHKNNLLPLFHISKEKDTEFTTTLLTEKEVTNLINATYRSQLQKAVTDKIESDTHAIEVTEKITTATDDLTAHIAGHMTEEDAAYWDTKAKAGHSHDHDGKIKLYAEDVHSGVFKADQIPDEVKERYYKIDALTELGDTSITDEERALKYHNGNAFYMATGENDTDGYPKYRWFRVVDSTKIGTPNYMEGLLEFTNELQPLSWELIIDRPTTLAGFGLDDEAYTKEETDNVIAPAVEKYNANKETAESWIETVDVLSTSGLVPPSGKSINRVGIQYKIANPTENNDMCEGSYIDVIAYINDGTVYKTRLTKNEETGRFIHLGFSWVKIHNADYSYFSARFPSSYTEDARNPKYATSGCGRCWYAASADTTAEIALPELFDWKYTMVFNTQRIIFKIPKPNVLESIAEINASANLNYEKIAGKLDEVYQKWGYPADVPEDQIKPKVIESAVSATLAMGVESVTTLPQLIPTEIPEVQLDSLPDKTYTVTAENATISAKKTAKRNISTAVETENNVTLQSGVYNGASMNDQVNAQVDASGLASSDIYAYNFDGADLTGVYISNVPDIPDVTPDPDPGNTGNDVVIISSDEVYVRSLVNNDFVASHSVEPTSQFNILAFTSEKEFPPSITELDGTKEVTVDLASINSDDFADIESKYIGAMTSAGIEYTKVIGYGLTRTWNPNASGDTYQILGLLVKVPAGNDNSYSLYQAHFYNPTDPNKTPLEHNEIKVPKTGSISLGILLRETTVLTNIPSTEIRLMSSTYDPPSGATLTINENTIIITTNNCTDTGLILNGSFTVDGKMYSIYLCISVGD